MEARADVGFPLPFGTLARVGSHCPVSDHVHYRTGAGVG